MKGPILVSGHVSQQLINIKKTSLDSDLKASVTIEFMVTDDESMLNYLRVATLQGAAAVFSAMPAQQDLFDRETAEAPKGGGNGAGKKEPVHA